MSEPEFSTYTLDELRDVYKHIDKKAYPDRVKKIRDEIKLRENGVAPEKPSQIEPEKTPDSTIKKGKKSARGIVLAIWPATILLSIYFGKLPSRDGFLYYSEEPGQFVTLLLIYIGVGIYFYNGRDDT